VRRLGTLAILLALTARGYAAPTLLPADLGLPTHGVMITDVHDAAPRELPSPLLEAALTFADDVAPGRAAATVADAVLVSHLAAGWTIHARRDLVVAGRAGLDLELERPAERRFLRLLGDPRAPRQLTLQLCAGGRAETTPCTDELHAQAAAPPADPDAAFVTRTLLVLLAIALASAGLTAALVKALRRRRLRANPPLVDLAPVTLTGVVRAAGPLLTAPLSGRPCLAYQARARLFDPIRPGHVIAAPTAIEMTPFVIVTPRGEVRVPAQPIAFAIAAATVIDRDADRERAFLTGHGVSAELHLGAGLDEVRLLPGATVVLAGMIRLERAHADTGERGFRDDAPLEPHLVGAGDAPLTLRDQW
jgi:hypothetical protein